MTVSLLLSTALLLPAWSADLVLHDGTVLDPAARAADLLPDLAPDARISTPATLAHDLPPAAPAPAQLRLCDGAPLDNADLAGAAQAAAGQVAYLEYQAAADGLDAALDRLPCLTEVAAADTLVQAWFLRGFVANELGQADQSRAAFRQALLFRPDLAWNRDYPDSGAPILEDVRADLQEAPGSLALAPTSATATVYVDGQQVDPGGPLALQAGQHLLQVVGDDTLSMMVSTGSVDQASLVLPTLLSNTSLEAVGTPQGQAGLDPVLDLATQPGDRVVLLTTDAAWLRTPDGWQALAASAADIPKDRHGLASGVRWSGLGLVLGGAALSGTGWLMGSGAVDDASAAAADGDTQAYAGAQDHYGTAQVLLPVGYGLAGAGAALFVTGFALDGSGPVRLGPMLLPGGAGLRLELRP